MIFYNSKTRNLEQENQKLRKEIFELQEKLRDVQQKCNIGYEENAKLREKIKSANKENLQLKKKINSLKESELNSTTNEYTQELNKIEQHLNVTSKSHNKAKLPLEKCFEINLSEFSEIKERNTRLNERRSYYDSVNEILDEAKKKIPFEHLYYNEYVKWFDVFESLAEKVNLAPIDSELYKGLCLGKVRIDENFPSNYRDLKCHPYAFLHQGQLYLESIIKSPIYSENDRFIIKPINKRILARCLAKQRENYIINLTPHNFKHAFAYSQDLLLPFPEDKELIEIRKWVEKYALLIKEKCVAEHVATIFKLALTGTYINGYGSLCYVPCNDDNPKEVMYF